MKYQVEGITKQRGFHKAAEGQCFLQTQNIVACAFNFSSLISHIIISVI